MLSRISLIFLAACLVGTTTSQAQDEPKKAEEAKVKVVDRSGEKLLKEALTSFGSQTGLRFDVARFERSSEADPYTYEGGASFLWASVLQFRIQAQGTWGDGCLIIRNLKDILIDNLSDGTAILKDAPEKTDELWKEIGNEFSLGITGLVMSGEGALPILAPEKASVTAQETADGKVTFETNGSEYGKVTLVATKGKQWRLLSVTRQRLPNENAGGWSWTPDFVKEEVSSMKPLGKVPGRLFETKAEPGIELIDTRKKAEKGTEKPPLLGIVQP